MVTPPTGASYKVPATQAELDRLGVGIDVKQFVDDTIRKPIAIPGTYERLAQSPKGLADVTEHGQGHH